MNSEYDIEDYQLPSLKRTKFVNLFPEANPSLLDLLDKLLVYSPNKRITAIDAICHEYFN